MPDKKQAITSQKSSIINIATSLPYSKKSPSQRGLGFTLSHARCITFAFSNNF